MSALEGSAAAASPSPPRSRVAVLTLGSLGVVYGDIGTSPLYAFREATVAAAAGGAVTPNIIMGVLSLMIWALVVIVTLKYVLILLNADNNGEGGTLSLMALLRRTTGSAGGPILVLGLIGTALFFGDALITPAISVLSAVEGLKLATPGIEPFILPLTVAILVGLFMVQRHGTARVAAFFGPITAVWFLAIAIVGATHIAQAPEVLLAFNPTYGVRFLLEHGWIALLTLGAVFLTVTGAEALYADLGHFGKRPIQIAWIGMVFPCLVLNYLGQGALVLHAPETLDNPFFRAVPEWALYPMIGLATAATVIASQAVITGAYSLSRQAMQLGLLPRLEIQHTSADQEGQIYMPQVNFLLLVGVLFLVILFKTSSALSTAYGIAVTGTMIVTAILAFLLMRRVWGWSLWLTSVVMVPLIVVDGVFLAANLLKVASGGWVPLVIGGGLVVVMWTWIKGAALLLAKTRRMEMPLAEFVGMIERKAPISVPGTAVFMTADPDNTPTALLHSLKHYKVLHERNMVVSIRFADLPHVATRDQIETTELSASLSKIILNYGYMDMPNVPAAIGVGRRPGLDVMNTSFFLSRRSLKPSPQGGMPLWQDKLFIFLARNASDATQFFRIPTDRTVEIGTRLVV